MEVQLGEITISQWQQQHVEIEKQDIDEMIKI